jgi:phosphoglycerol transferase MdoB-like AlkP superfamily enzyme
MKKLRASHLKRFFVHSLHALLIYGFLLLIFMICRLIILFCFNHAPEIYRETDDLFKAFSIGFRFDTMVICYGLFPVLAGNLAGIFLPARYDAILEKVSRIYYVLLIMSILLISVIDLYFYNFFAYRINVLIFGFAEDDTWAVLKSIWTDYPMLYILAGGVVAGWLVYKLTGMMIRRIRMTRLHLPAICYVAFLPLLCLLFLLGIRGSCAFYPLKIKDSAVSPYVFINNLVPNGVYALKTAIRDHREQHVNVHILKEIKKWGFQTPQEAIELYTGRKPADHPDSLKAALIAHTPVNAFLENNRPNVVFIQMESMSEDFISLHEKETFNLLGTLEDVLPRCLHFTHFLPATSATIHTLEGLLLNSPMTPISQSCYMNRTLTSSAAKPFKEKGYHTVFVTGGKLGWRNLDKFIPNQYFDRVEGSTHIEKRRPDVSSNEWGCYDEFMFDRILDLLQQDTTGQPQFLFGLTVTNHTPYSLPDTYRPRPVCLPETLKARLSSGEKHAQTHFRTYQYANDCLGRFITAIIRSPQLRENTIIAASGDHSARRIFDYPDANMLQKYAVPLLLYVPEKYMQGLEKPDTSQFASHKDIFPTLYNLALSDVAYVRSGINLFDKKALAGNFAVSNYKLLMSREGCVFYETHPVYYTWSDEKRTKLEPAKEADIPPLGKKMEYAKSYTASMTFFVQEDLRDASRKPATATGKAYADGS